MNAIRKTCLVGIVTLGGIIGGDASIGGIRHLVYNDQKAKIEEIKSPSKRKIELEKFEKNFRDYKSTAYIMFRAAGGLLGLLLGLGIVFSDGSSGEGSTGEDIYDSPRTAGEHYLGVS